MATAHNEAEKGEIARIVLMPGDPLRARHIAQTYLDQPVQFNAVRGMLEYTGEYRTVDVHIRRLREKVEQDPAHPAHLCTKWGVGYYFKEA